MTPPKKFSVYLTEQMPGVDLKQAKLILNHFRKWNHLAEYHYCRICSKQLTDEERLKITIHDFNPTCTAHDKYRNVYNIDIARKDAGVLESPELIVYDLE